MLKKGKMYHWKEDESDIDIIFIVRAYHWRKREDGSRSYTYDITTILDKSADGIKWDNGEKINRVAFQGIDKYCKEIPDSEAVLLMLGD